MQQLGKSDCRAERMENIVFDFRIINLPDGNQVIDTSLKTPYNALTLAQMEEYIEMDVQLAIADKLKRKVKAEEKRRQKLARNLLRKLACFCGLV